jgi:UDP-N-acetylglucosamine transferase subunit ALG13
MILVTTGTNEQPFDRLVRAAAALAEREEAFVQYGSSRVPHGEGEWVDFLDFDELADRMRGARVVVCHAGVGSIMLARKCGHQPVVLPRRVDLGEAVDDHQLLMARRLHAAGLVRLVEDDADLPAAVAGHASRDLSAGGGERLAGAAALTSELRNFLGTLVPIPMTLATAPASAQED